MKSLHFLVCLGVFLFCKFSVLEIRAQENYTLVKIEFLGNKTFSSDQLLKHLAIMYPTNAFSRIVLRKKPVPYNEEALQKELDRLVRFYQREGFLHVKVENSKLAADAKKKTVKLTIKIFEGEPIQVGKLDHEIIAATPEDEKQAREILDKMKPSLALPAGAKFRDGGILADQERISAAFNQAGFPYIKIDYRLVVAETNRVDINWQAVLGPRCVFGDIKISGNQRVSTSLIRKQLALRPGQLFRAQLLNQSQKQIYDLGFFQIVTVRALLGKEQSPNIPVLVVVKEVSRLTTRVGIGYGKEDKFRAYVSLIRLGTLGGSRRLQLLVKHSALEPYNFNLKIIQPSFIAPKNTLILNPFALHQNEPGFVVTRFGGNLTVQRELAEKNDVYITYTLEQVKQDDQTAASRAADDMSGADLYNKSSVTVGLSRDTAIPIFTPSQGMFSALSFTVSGLGFNSKYNFTKLVVDLRRYQKFFDRQVFAYRLKLGALKSYDADGVIPVEEKFFAGGSTSVRGWARSELGPLDAEGVPLGGNSLLEASIEWRFPIWQSFAGVAFTDFGNVWLESYAFKLDDLRYSVGLGWRYDTPIGPIRLDVARPIFDEETKTQIMLSVGHAF